MEACIPVEGLPPCVRCDFVVKSDFLSEMLHSSVRYDFQQRNVTCEEVAVGGFNADQQTIRGLLSRSAYACQAARNHCCTCCMAAAVR